MNQILNLLAQATTPGGNPAGQGGPAAPGAGAMLFPAMILFFVVFMFLTQSSKAKRERKEREELQASLKKNVKVMTIGGIYGTIVSVKEDDVVLKVDESSNTKMTFRKTAIQQLVSDA